MVLPGSRRAGWLALVGVVSLPFLLPGSGRVVDASVPAPSAPPPRPATVLVDLVDGASEADLGEISQLTGVTFTWLDPRARDEALATGHAAAPGVTIAFLREDPRVEAVEVDSTMFALGFPDDPLYERQWNLPAVGAPDGWALTPRGRGVVVAVIDTGVASVPDLAGTSVLGGASFVPGVASAVDDQGHGTHVAGTIAQTTNNGVGVAGMAPESTILPVKVLSATGAGQAGWIAAGIDWAVDEGADVINLSLGGAYSEVIHTAIRKARAQGVLVVAAAGNTGREGVSWPGALPEAIGVGAVGPGGAPAPYSSWGEGVDLSAPGGDKRHAGGGILQDTLDGAGGHAYLEFQGTSMATPHVAGAAAALLSAGVPARAVEAVLLDTAKGGRIWDSHLGWGQLDLGRAARRVNDGWGAARFALAVAVASLGAWIGRAGTRYGVTSAAVAGIVASGVFLLPHLPVGGAMGVQVASRGLLALPLLVSPDWMHSPIWLTAGLPVLIAFTAGAFRAPRPVAAGLCAGVGAHLLHGAATGSLAPWWMSASTGGLWLGAHAAICIALTLALAGAHHLESRDV